MYANSGSNSVVVIVVVVIAQWLQWQKLKLDQG